MVGHSWRWNPPTHPTTPQGFGPGGLFYVLEAPMDTLILILYILAAVSFVIALGLLFWVMVYLVPLLAK